jgi:hypothetical protein
VRKDVEFVWLERVEEATAQAFGTAPDATPLVATGT